MLHCAGGRVGAGAGRRGWFWSEWSAGGGDWLRVKVTAEEVPRIQPTWLAAERRRIGEWWFKQEYMCEFADDEGQLVGSAAIDAAADARIRPLFGGQFGGRYDDANDS